MTRCKVSVAMAVYNGEKYLAEQLDSILEQLGAEDELVISYDESTDNTVLILNEYSLKYPQVKIVKNRGKGVFDNFENAIANTNGDFIFISDQDDRWISGKKDLVLEDFELSKADMIIHNGVHINEQGVVISKDFFSTYGIGKGLFINFVRPRYSGCCMAFRNNMKNLLLPIPRDVGAYDHWIGMVGEVFGSIYFDNRVLLEHRLHGDNVTVTTRDFSTIINARFNLLCALKKRSKER